MPRVRISIVSAVTAAALITFSACQGSAQNAVQLPSASSKSIEKLSASTTGGYTITDLGALPGKSYSEVSRGLEAVSPFGGNPLNNVGQVAGTSYSPDTATLFSNGTATNINTLNSSQSFAIAVNGSGQVVGEEESGTCNCGHAFLFTNGSMKDINDNSVFPNGSVAIGINKTGQIVGGGTVNSSTFHAFLYSNGRMTDVNPFPGSNSNAVSINDSGQIIGSSGKTNLAGTWLLSNGTVTILSQTTTSFDINNNGQIVGQNSSNRPLQQWSLDGSRRHTGSHRDRSVGYQRLRPDRRFCRISGEELSSVHPGLSARDNLQEQRSDRFK